MLSYFIRAKVPIALSRAGIRGLEVHSQLDPLAPADSWTTMFRLQSFGSKIEILLSIHILLCPLNASLSHTTISGEML